MFIELEWADMTANQQNAMQAAFASGTTGCHTSEEMKMRELDELVKHDLLTKEFDHRHGRYWLYHITLIGRAFYRRTNPN